MVLAERNEKCLIEIDPEVHAYGYQEPPDFHFFITQLHGNKVSVLQQQRNRTPLNGPVAKFSRTELNLRRPRQKFNSHAETSVQLAFTSDRPIIGRECSNQTVSPVFLVSPRFAVAPHAGIFRRRNCRGR